MMDQSLSQTSSRVPTVVEVDLGNRSYPIYIGSGLLQQPELLQRYLDLILIKLLLDMYIWEAFLLNWILGNLCLVDEPVNAIESCCYGSARLAVRVLKRCRKEEEFGI